MGVATAEPSVGAEQLDRAAREAERRVPLSRGSVIVAAAVVAWAAMAAVTAFVPNDRPFPLTNLFAVICLVGAAGIAAAAALAPRAPAVRRRLLYWAPWLAALGVYLLVWEVVTAKLSLLELPYFTPPQAILDVYREDGGLLAESVVSSLKLIGLGYFAGAFVGVVCGVAMGWWQGVNYWLHPILRTIGPVPAAAWIPLFFVVFPSSFTAAVFIIALAAWFPVTILTFSGVAGVTKRYYDVALTLGASERFLIWKVAIPAALPNIFVGLFMGLGFSFVTIVVAEIFGASSGLGYYINWVRGWAAYTNMYAAIILMAIVFSALIWLLFTIRDRVLSWQKGVIRW